MRIENTGHAKTISAALAQQGLIDENERPRVGRPTDGKARELRRDREAERPLEGRRLKRPDMQLVDSSAITAIGYDPKQELCFIEWKGSGETYAYESVTKWEYDQLLTAESIGAHVNRFIKPGRRYHKLPEDSQPVAPLLLLENCAPDEDPDPTPNTQHPTPSAIDGLNIDARRFVSLHKQPNNWVYFDHSNGARLRAKQQDLAAFHKAMAGQASDGDWQDFFLDHAETMFHGVWMPLTEALRLEAELEDEHDASTAGEGLEHLMEEAA